MIAFSFVDSEQTQSLTNLGSYRYDIISLKIMFHSQGCLFFEIDSLKTKPVHSGINITKSPQIYVFLL